MIYHCCQQNRRTAVAQHPTLNGIDYLEVIDKVAPSDALRQRTLILYLLKPVPVGWSADNVRIVGGERVRNPLVEWVMIASALDNALLLADEITYFSALPNLENIVLIRTESRGDFSDYCLQLQQGLAEPPLPPNGFDPRLVEVTFSFKVECPSNFDCLDSSQCEQPALTDPDINYLAKDYASFRQLILDRMNTIIPDWGARSPADLGVTLAELVAYVGDQYSYWQDAVTTEAYIHTARKRISLRRHAKLVDYVIGEGRNARAWLQLTVTGGPFLLDSTGLQFLTRVEQIAARIEPGSKAYTVARQQQALVFELLHNTPLIEAHNQMSFYTWGDNKCCLPKKATTATLLGHYPQLLIDEGNNDGQYLLFEEVVGPLSGAADDADPSHRQVVRLIHAELTSDPLDDTDITEIYWSAADALTFPVCISSEINTDEASATELADVSVVRGNMIIIDHGETLHEELGAVAAPWLYYPQDRDTQHCSPAEKQPIYPRFRPQLSNGPLTHSAAPPAIDSSAAAVLLPPLTTVYPMITVSSGTEIDAQIWPVKADLLNSADEDNDVVVELNNEGIAQLRFGDGNNGARPDAGDVFSARYRVGNGAQGNVGADSIAHIVSLDGRVVAVRNPLPAQGGVEPETLAQIRRRAPQAFRSQLRAVTPEDYATFTTAQAGVQLAAATPRWTGSWHTQTITVDRDNGLPLDSAFVAQLATGIERYRMAGHDIKFNDPVFVSLQLEIQVCVSRDYFVSDVQQALLDIFNSGAKADGSIGLFHPDNFSFGQTVYLSPFYAAARQVRGVSSVQITRFSRQGESDVKALVDGFMKLGRLEIPRLDNDPNFPEHGIVEFIMLGGK
jgi:hypothetical protein